jgi:hypothetical protein
MTDKLILDLQLNVLYRNMQLFNGLVNKKIKECESRDEMEHLTIIKNTYSTIQPKLEEIVEQLKKCKELLEKT